MDYYRILIHNFIDESSASENRCKLIKWQNFLTAAKSDHTYNYHKKPELGVLVIAIQ